MSQQLATHVSPVRKFVLVAAACLPMALGGSAALAVPDQSPNPPDQASAQAPAASTDAADAPLTDQSLGVMLTNMGLQPTANHGSNITTYTVPAHYDGYDFSACVTLSTDRKFLWVDCTISNTMKPDQINQQLLVNLMEMNEEDGVTRISFNASDNRFHVAMVIPNSNVTPAMVLSTLNLTYAEVARTQPVFTKAPTVSTTGGATTQP